MRVHQVNVQSLKEALRSLRIPMPLVATLLFLSALLTVVAWAVASPPGSSPDEDFHLGSITCPHPASEFCEVSEIPIQNVTGGQASGTQLAIWIPFQTAHANCNAPVAEFSAECFDEMADFGYTWSTRFDYAGVNPVGFYRAMHVLRNVGSNLANTVFTMRIINGTLSVLLFGATALLFTHRNRRLMAYALLLVLAPMALYLMVSINPSSWAISGVTLAWLGIHGFLTEKLRSRRWGLFAVGVAGAVLAALSRGDAALFVVIAALATAVMHWQIIKANWRLLIAPAAVALVAMVGFLSSGQVESASGGLSDQGPGGFLFDNVLNLPTFLIDAVVGPLNWLDTALPGISRIPVIMIGAGVAFVGMRRMDIPKALALLGLFFVLTALPIILLELTGQQLGLYVQARYLTPLIPLLMLTALWNPHSCKVQRFSNPQLWLIWATLAIGHAWALHTQILRFTHGLAIRWWNLNTAPEWWAFGISPMATWAIGSLAFAGLLLGLFAVSGKGHRRSAPLTESTEQTFYAPIAPIVVGADRAAPGGQARASQAS